MKSKILMVMTAVSLVFGALPAFSSEVTVSGNLEVTGYTNEDDSAAGLNDTSVDITAELNENFTVGAELSGNGGIGETAFDFNLESYYLSADVDGALGLDIPLDIDAVTGYTDADFGEESATVSRSGNELYAHDIQNEFCDFGDENMNGMLQVSATYDMLTTYWWNDYSLDVFRAGASYKLGGLNVMAAYAGYFDNPEDGNLWVEAGYGMDMNDMQIYIPATFTYNMDGEVAGADSAVWAWSSGASIDVSGVHASVAVGGNEDEELQTIIPEISTSLLAGIDLYAIANIDLSADDEYQSTELGGAYSFGNVGLNLGYVIADDDISTNVCGDEFSVTGNSYYFMVSAAF